MRTKIGFDGYKYQRSISQVNGIIEEIPKLKEILNSVRIELTHDMLIDASTGSVKIEENIRIQVQKDIEGLQNPIVIKNATSGVNMAIIDLRAKIGAINGLYSSDRNPYEAAGNLDLIEISNEEGKLVANWQATLLERASLFTEDPNEIRVFEAHQKAASALEELQATFGTGRKLAPLAFMALFNFENDITIAENISYAVLSSKLL